jgi:hypothetical protein
METVTPILTNIHESGVVRMIIQRENGLQKRATKKKIARFLRDVEKHDHLPVRSILQAISITGKQQSLGIESNISSQLPEL